MRAAQPYKKQHCHSATAFPYGPILFYHPHYQSPLSRQLSPSPARGQPPRMAPDSAVEASRGPSRPLHITDLPRELQKEIVSHVPQQDLICLCLVSQHFRDLAAAELYRTFHIIFPVDGLANGLETFATSNYDYAKHLREVSLDTVSAGDKAEICYKQYLASQSCGKFMNTLLLLMLRGAKALEKLRCVALRAFLIISAWLLPGFLGWLCVTDCQENATGGTSALSSAGPCSRRSTRSIPSLIYTFAFKPALRSTSLHHLCPSIRHPRQRPALWATSRSLHI